MTSQEHRDKAQRFYDAIDAEPGSHETDMRRLARAQVHATLAVYEGMYELLGDDSNVDAIKRAIQARQ